MTQKVVIEHADQRLVRIRQTGMYIDPTTIVTCHAIANAQRHYHANGNSSAGKVVLETRARGQFTIPCANIKEAKQLAETLCLLANKRAQDARKLRVQQSTDYGTKKLAGNPDYYEEERNEVFMAFD